MSNPPKNRQPAVLFVNLGTPNAPTPKAVRRYLTEFLLDRQVVDLPPFFWKPLLRWCILPKRLPVTVANYSKIWCPQGSPLAFYSAALVAAVQSLLPAGWGCALAMTYGDPSLTDILTRLKDYSTIKVIPLFPQYSTTTTVAVAKRIHHITQFWTQSPTIDILYDYAAQEDYIAALVTQIMTSFATHGRPDALLISYHGIPIQYVKKRQDPYLERCQLTTAALRQALLQLGIVMPMIHSYQSRFGKGKWSEPNTADSLIDLATHGYHHVQVLCPGFAVDCIETLEEINVENRQRFLASGGRQFHYIAALNDCQEHARLLRKLVDQITHLATQ